MNPTGRRPEAAQRFKWPIAAWRELRDGVLCAVLPMQTAEHANWLAKRDSLWHSFSHSAPTHLQLALSGAVLTLGIALPLVWGYGSPLHRLSDDKRQAVIDRADGIEAFRPLLDVVKVTACWFYFDDDAVQKRVRGENS